MKQGGEPKQHDIQTAGEVNLQSIIDGYIQSYK